MLLSGIVLVPSSDERYDGIWSAEEISALDLDGTRLVAMSACETGMGKSGGAEGLMGSPQAAGWLTGTGWPPWPRKALEINAAPSSLLQP